MLDTKIVRRRQLTSPNPTPEPYTMYAPKTTSTKVYTSRNLQSNHTSTNAEGHQHVEAHSKVANGEDTGNGGAMNGKIVATASSLGIAAAADGRGSGGGFLVSVTGLGQGIRARGVRVGTLGLSGAVKVASILGLLLAAVIGIKNVGKLLLIAAHAVGTVDTSSGIAIDTGARFGRGLADEAKDVAEFLDSEAGLGDASTGLDHAGAETLIGGRREGLVSLPVVGQLGALVHLATGLVLGHFHGLGRGPVDLLLQGVKVLELCGFAARNLDQTVIVGLLVVHVDDTTAEGASHVIRVQGGGFVKDTVGSAVVVATILGKEYRDRVVLKEFNLLIIAGLLHRALSTPRVDVVTPEINRLFDSVAVEVVGNLSANILVIVGGVANTKPSGNLLVVLYVGLGVSNSGLDKGRGSGIVLSVGDLVSSKEADDVGVLGKLINDSRVTLKQGSVPLRSVAVDGIVGLAEIRHDVNAGILQQLHAGLVVGLGVDGVGSNDVGAELLEKRDITLANSLIGERVDVVLLCIGGRRRRTTGADFLLVSNTLHVELSSVFVEEFGALYGCNCFCQKLVSKA